VGVIDKRLAALSAVVFVAAPLALLGQQEAAAPDARTRQILDQFFAGQYDGIYAQFAPEMKKRISLEAYKTQAAQIKGLGKVESIGTPTARSAGELTMVTIPVVFPVVALDFVVNWNKDAQIAGTFFRPTAPMWTRPAYSKPNEFEEREVSIGADEWKLPGTLTLPTGDGPFPAVVLVHGSGPMDRDETVGGAKVFKDLAEGLSSDGIAVLRYEKRTRVYRSKMATEKNLTMTMETVDDAVAAVEFLEKQAFIDPKRIYVLGHSQGGYMMPRIVKRAPRLAGAIIMAGNARPLQDLMIQQTQYIQSLKGEPTPAEQKALEAQKQELAKIAALEPGKENPQTIMRLPSSYFLDLKGYNPAEEAKKLTLPLLIIQGERDYQVTMADFNLWKAALDGRKNATLKSYPKLNHLFVAGEGRATPAEYQKAGHVAADVIDDLAKWIESSKRG
jgi:uncharacterized protein